jgi:hypothetical protein
MTQKIVISKAGYDAGTVTDVANIIYSSDYDTLKYYTSGSISVTTSGTHNEGTIAHNLGYIPFFVAFASGVTPEGYYAMIPQMFADAGDAAYVTAYADNTNLYFRIETNMSVTANYYYKIFRNDTGL